MKSSHHQLFCLPAFFLAILFMTTPVAAQSVDSGHQQRLNPSELTESQRCPVERTQDVTLDSQVSPPVDLKCRQMLCEIEAEHEAALKIRADLVRKQLEFYSAQLNSDIAAVPRYFYVKGNLIPCGSYKPTVDALQAVYDKKVEDVAREADRNSAELNDYYARKKSGLISSHQGLGEQMVSRTGSSKIVRTGTSMYVHNYINFGGSSAQPQTHATAP